MSVRWWTVNPNDLEILMPAEFLSPHIFANPNVRSRITGDGYDVTDPNGVDWGLRLAWTLGDPRDGRCAYPDPRSPDPGYRFSDEVDVDVLALAVLTGVRP